MKLAHFEQHQPICIVCQNATPLSLEVSLKHGEDVLQGRLRCTNPHCRRDYPIVDGLPILIHDLRAFFEQQIYMIRSRADLTDAVEQCLSQFAPAHNVYESQKQILSTYLFDHYGDQSADFADINPAPGQVLKLVRRCLSGLESAKKSPSGHWLDLGCGPGRSSFEIAQHCESVLGLDMGFGLIRIAQQVQQSGSLNLDLRDVGRLYKRTVLDVKKLAAPNVDFWIVDATQLPFKASTIDGIIALNLLDCVKQPVALIQQCYQTLKHNAPLCLTSPYDWTESATPIDQWLGGVRRDDHYQGQSATMVAEILKSQSFQFLNSEEIDWELRLHARSMMKYAVQINIAAALKVESPD